MHYWRALKASKYNVVHCDPSAGAAWLSAPLCVFHMKRGPPLKEAPGCAERGLKDHSEEFLMSHLRPSLSHLCGGCESSRAGR